MAIEVNYKSIELAKVDKVVLPLSLRKIVYNDFIDSQVPYKDLFNPKTHGQLYGQHSQRKISLLIDYTIIAQTQHDQLDPS